MQNKTHIFFQVYGTVVLCAKPLCPKVTQVDSGRTLYRVSHTTPQKKSICLAGPLLIENVTTFFLSWILMSEFKTFVFFQD